MTHQLAVASELIRADTVEAIEFPHLANRYQVFGVPLTLINETVRVEGAAPEARFVQELLRAIEEEKKPEEAAWHG